MPTTAVFPGEVGRYHQPQPSGGSKSLSVSQAVYSIVEVGDSTDNKSDSIRLTGCGVVARGQLVIGVVANPKCRKIVKDLLVEKCLSENAKFRPKAENLHLGEILVEKLYAEHL